MLNLKLKSEMDSNKTVDEKKKIRMTKFIVLLNAKLMIFFSLLLFFIQPKNLGERMHDRSPANFVQTCDATFANLCPCLFGCWINRALASAMRRVFCRPHQGKISTFSLKITHWELGPKFLMVQNLLQILFQHQILIDFGV